MSSVEIPLVLVVEDNNTDYDLLVEQLVTEYLLVRAKDGSAAIEMLLGGATYYAAIIDLLLPGTKTGADVSLVAADLGVPVLMLTTTPALAQMSGSLGSIMEKGAAPEAVLTWLRSLT